MYICLEYSLTYVVHDLIVTLFMYDSFIVQAIRKQCHVLDPLGVLLLIVISYVSTRIVQKKSCHARLLLSTAMTRGCGMSAPAMSHAGLKLTP